MIQPEVLSIRLARTREGNHFINQESQSCFLASMREDGRGQRAAHKYCFSVEARIVQANETLLRIGDA